MKIMEFMKKRKLMVVICCIATLIGGVCICLALQPEAAQAKAGSEKHGRLETEAEGKDVPEGKGQEEGERMAAGKLEKGQKARGQIEDAASNNKESTTASAGFQSRSPGNGTSSRQGKQEVTKESPQTVHEHIWEPIVELQEVQEKRAVYGDKCNTCNKDVTGYAEEHILGSNCMGYSTDVFIRYEYETVKKPVVVGHRCGCGVRK